MRLPPKSYFHLTEIAKCWDASVEDLACYTLDGLLEISVMTIGARVVIGWLEIADNGVFRIPEDEKVLNGPQPVISSDLWSVFRGGSAEIVRFKPTGPTGYCELVPDADPILVTLQDLLVTRAERDRFEAKYGLLQSVDTPVEDCAAEPAFFERNDYAEVVLHGEVFRLGLLQAAVVRELHQAAQSDNPWRLGKNFPHKCKCEDVAYGRLVQAEAKLAHAHRL